MSIIQMRESMDIIQWNTSRDDQNNKKIIQPKYRLSSPIVQEN
jgi:hypothetical protein